MDVDKLEARILARGKEFFALLGDETPSIFNKNWWTGKVMDWSMSDEDFKIQLFRFIDVLPYLTTEKMLNDHIKEYFARGQSVPAVLRFGAKSAGIGGRLGMKVLGKTIRKNLESMALQFIIGNTVPGTVKNLGKHVELAYPNVASLARQLRDTCDVFVQLKKGQYLRPLTGCLLTVRLMQEQHLSPVRHRYQLVMAHQPRSVQDQCHCLLCPAPTSD